MMPLNVFTIEYISVLKVASEEYIYCKCNKKTYSHLKYNVHVWTTLQFFSHKTNLWPIKQEIKKYLQEIL